MDHMLFFCSLSSHPFFVNVFLCNLINPNILLLHQHAELSSSVLSDHSLGSERKARHDLHRLLYPMFGADAFKEDVDLNLTNRQIRSDFEIDFCSTLHVHEGFRIRDRPVEQMKKMKFLLGDWESWLRKIVPKQKQVSSSDEQAGRGSPQSDLTDEMTSVKATHYVICETKISKGKKSVEERLIQLERNLRKMCERKGATPEEAPHKAVEIIALAGIGVPHENRQFDNNCIMQKINKKPTFPVLQALLKEERVFVLEVDSAHHRLDQLEGALERQEKTLNKLKEGQERQEKLLLDFFRGRNQAGNDS